MVVVFALPDLLLFFCARRGQSSSSSAASKYVDDGSAFGRENSARRRSRRRNEATLRYLRTLPEPKRKALPGVGEESVSASSTDGGDGKGSSSGVSALSQPQQVDLAVTQFDTASLDLDLFDDVPLQPDVPDPFVADRDVFDVLEVDMVKLREELVGMVDDGELEELERMMEMEEMDTAQQESLQRQFYNRRMSVRRASKRGPAMHPEGDFMSTENGSFRHHRGSSARSMDSTASVAGDSQRRGSQQSRRPSAEYLQTDGLSRITSVRSARSSWVSQAVSELSGASKTSSELRRLTSITEAKRERESPEGVTGSGGADGSASARSRDDGEDGAMGDGSDGSDGSDGGDGGDGGKRDEGEEEQGVGEQPHVAEQPAGFGAMKMDDRMRDFDGEDVDDADPHQNMSRTTSEREERPEGFGAGDGDSKDKGDNADEGDGSTYDNSDFAGSQTATLVTPAEASDGATATATATAAEKRESLTADEEFSGMADILASLQDKMDAIKALEEEDDEEESDGGDGGEGNTTYF